MLDIKKMIIPNKYMALLKICSPFKTEVEEILLKSIPEIRSTHDIKNNIFPFLLKILFPSSIPIITIPEKDNQNKIIPI